MYKWFTDYLRDRQQYTIINDSKSDEKFIKYGVPQGSVLGPLLFLIYINDITNCSPNCNIRLFADDTNILIFDPDVNNLFLRGNKILTELTDWLLANKLSVNTEKTNYSLFSPSKSHGTLTANDPNLKLYICGKETVRATCVKYLGITIDENLKWNEHIKLVYNKVIKYTGIFYKIRQKLPDKCLKNLYYATVYPHILYGIEIYANTNKTFLNELMILNNKLLRTIQKKDMKTNVLELYEEYHTLPIDLLHRYKVMLFMHKFLNNKQSLPNGFTNYFILNKSIHGHSTRSVNDFHLENCQTSFGTKSMRHIGPSLWNSLPIDLKYEHSLQNFQKKLRVYLINPKD